MTCLIHRTVNTPDKSADYLSNAVFQHRDRSINNR